MGLGTRLASTCIANRPHTACTIGFNKNAVRVCVVAVSKHVCLLTGLCMCVCRVVCTGAYLGFGDRGGS